MITTTTTTTTTTDTTGSVGRSRQAHPGAARPRLPSREYRQVVGPLVGARSSRWRASLARGNVRVRSRAQGDHRAPHRAHRQRRRPGGRHAEWTATSAKGRMTSVRTWAAHAIVVMAVQTAPPVAHLPTVTNAPTNRMTHPKRHTVTTLSRKAAQGLGLSATTAGTAIARPRAAPTELAVAPSISATSAPTDKPLERRSAGTNRSSTRP